ncbi:sugar transferase [Candidatus Peregrinibacteria bacterium]|nr:sugar transferase [Candidatus Peregrinibacteria bacterium]
MKKGDIAILLFRVPLDFASVSVAWILAYFLRPLTDLLPWVQFNFAAGDLPLWSFFFPFLVTTAFAFVFLLFFLGYYRFDENFEPVREIFRLIFATFLWGMLIVAWYALFRHELIFSRVMLFQAMIFSVLFTFFSRTFLRWLQMIFWKAGKNHKKIILFGNSQSVATIKSILQKFPQFEIVEEFSEKEIHELSKGHYEADELWRCEPKTSENTARILQEICTEKHLFFRFVPQENNMAFARLEISLFGKTPLILAVPALPRVGDRVGKRIFDILASLILVLLLSPIFLLVSFLIFVTSRGPIFYKSKRIGAYGKSFIMWKFRSMYPNADKFKKHLSSKNHRDGPLFKVKNDPRITPIGRFLRRISFDELPNLMNVLRGDMSLVGPRPHLPEEVEKYEVSHKRVLMMKPGVTGLSQISGRSDLPFAEEIRLDIYYLENWSFWLDIKILLKTVLVVLSRKGAD